MHVVKKPKDVSFNRVGVKGTIFPTEKLTSKTQFILIETKTGHDTTIIEHKCDFSYYVLDGSGYFIIDGKKELCRKGDLVIIPAGKAFTYKGKLKTLLNVTPIFTPDQEEVL